MKKKENQIKKEIVGGLDSLHRYHGLSMEEILAVAPYSEESRSALDQFLEDLQELPVYKEIAGEQNSIYADYSADGDGYIKYIVHKDNKDVVSYLKSWRYQTIEELSDLAAESLYGMQDPPKEKIAITFAEEISAEESEKIEEEIQRILVSAGLAGEIESTKTGNSVGFDPKNRVKYDEHGGRCTTLCPHGFRGKVHSIFCQKCEWYGSEIDDNSILCRY